MRGFLLALTAMGGVSQSASAGLVRLDFAGTVTFVEVRIHSQSLADELSASIVLGTPFSGTVVVDDSFPPGHIPGYSWTTTQASPPASLFVSVDGYTAATGDTSSGSGLDGRIELHVDGYGPTDPRVVRIYSTLAPLSGAVSDELFYLDFRLTLYAGDDPPGSEPVTSIPWTLDTPPAGLVNLDFVRLLDSGYTQRVVVHSSIDFVTATRVPEPGAAVLCAIAFIALGALGFRRARS